MIKIGKKQVAPAIVPPGGDATGLGESTTGSLDSGLPPTRYTPISQRLTGLFAPLNFFFSRHQRLVTAALIGSAGGLLLVGCGDPNANKPQRRSQPKTEWVTPLAPAEQPSPVGHVVVAAKPKAQTFEPPATEQDSIAAPVDFPDEPLSAGRDSAGLDFSLGPEVSGSFPTWFSSDWFLADVSGTGRGDPRQNMWAIDGPLHKLDTVQRSASTSTSARQFELQAPSWFGSGLTRGGALRDGNEVSEAHFGHDVGKAQLYKLAFGDAAVQLEPEVLGLDFLDQHGRSELREGSRLGIFLDGKRVGQKRSALKNGTLIRLLHPDGRRLLSKEEGERAYFAVLDRHGEPLGDGVLDQKVSTQWWGNCDVATLAALYFAPPRVSVTRDGVTFTPRDITALLTMVAADLDEKDPDFVGERYRAFQDEIELKDGQRIRGEVRSSMEPFRAQRRLPAKGDWHEIHAPSEDIRIELANGQIKTLKAGEIVRATVQLGEDLAPWDLIDAVKRMIARGGGAADVDFADRVYNRPFKSADFDSSPVRPAWATPASPTEALAAAAGLKIEWGEVTIHYGDRSRTHRYFTAKDASGKPVDFGYYVGNGADPPPDFLWGPKDLRPRWPAKLTRNPKVDVGLVKAVYEASLQPPEVLAANDVPNER